MAFYLIEIIESRTVLIEAENSRSAALQALAKCGSEQALNISTKVIDEYVDPLAVHCEHSAFVDLTQEVKNE